MPLLDPFGLRRVISPVGVMPQAAEKIDPHLPLSDDELEIDVDHLNVDAASFRQIERSVGGEVGAIAARILEIVQTRGKLHNPVTGSGGMLIGRVKKIGERHPAATTLKVGDRIATLVSLSLTPLVIDEIRAVHPHAERVDVKARAVLFASGLYAKLPSDFSDEEALAVLDVCGAPAWVSRLAGAGETVLVIGAGKSGALSCAAARKKVGPAGRVLSLDLDAAAAERLVEGGLADVAIAANAQRPVEVYEKVLEATGGAGCDFVVNCASVSGTEMASILSTKEGGRVLFFSMATSFTSAALGAEGCGKDITMYVGNGYAKGHAEEALELVRGTPSLRRVFEARVRG